LYQGGTYLAPAKVKLEMSPPHISSYHQSPKKRKATAQLGRDRLKMKVSFLIHDVVSQYYHLYAMLHAYQKFRNMCPIY
jgi:hypothetical protein